MLIAFIHAGSSFLPEIAAYQHFFSKRNIKTITAGFNDADTIQADVLWYIMGFSMRRRKDVVTIHEYTSASAPPNMAIKNAAKKLLNTKPDFRLFLNKYVKDKLGFNDNVPFGYRDMGVDFSIFHPPTRKEILYDFIYVGNLHYTRGLDSLFASFITRQAGDKSLLIVSRDYEKLQFEFSSFPNIHFAGPVPAGDVAAYINSSAFAINYIPDREPYNNQTSTKLLEYAACRIPIITTSYEWIKQFQREYGGNYFFLNKDLSNFHWQSVNTFNYAFPDLSTWDWDSQILNSGITHFLATKFPEEAINLKL